jgi:hypothetical protein
MQQQHEERAFIPLSVERGRSKKWQVIRLCFSSFSNMKNAGKARLNVYSQEGTGYARAVSQTHNKARFRARARLLPKREAEQARAHADTRADERRRAVIALRFARRYGTATTQTINRAKKAGIKIRADARILPYAEYRRRVMAEIQQQHTRESEANTRTEARTRE